MHSIYTYCMSVTVYARVSEPVYDALKRRGAAEGHTMAWMVEQALRAYLAGYLEGKETGK